MLISSADLILPLHWLQVAETWVSRDGALGLLPLVPICRRLEAAGLQDTLLLRDSLRAQTHLSMRDQASPAGSTQAAGRKGLWPGRIWWVGRWGWGWTERAWKTVDPWCRRGKCPDGLEFFFFLIEVQLIYMQCVSFRHRAKLFTLYICVYVCVYIYI